jgi:CelD/BcsL family acetyltransferase involved in cellulose biosynthesis
MKSPFSVRCVTSEEDFARLEPVWNDLLARSEVHTLFLSWDWLSTWWKVFGPGLGQLSIIVVEAQGEVVGIAPCYIKRERETSLLPSRTLMFLGAGEKEEEEIDSDYLSIITQSGEEEAIVTCILDYIVSQNICDAIRFSKMILDATIAERINRYFLEKRVVHQVEQTTSAFYIPLPETWDGYLMGLSSRMRNEIRSDRRKLAKSGEVQFRTNSSPEGLNADFAELARLHQLHWVSKGQPGVFENSKFALFHQTIMPRLLKNGFLSLCFLSVNSKNIGVCYHFRFNNKVCFYQTGFDPESVPHVSVGLVTLSFCVEQAILWKCSEYDFLGGIRSYKKRLAHLSRPLGEIYIPLRPITRYGWQARQAARYIKQSSVRLLRIGHPVAERD